MPWMTSTKYLFLGKKTLIPLGEKERQGLSRMVKTLLFGQVVPKVLLHYRYQKEHPVKLKYAIDNLEMN